MRQIRSTYISSKQENYLRTRSDVMGWYLVIHAWVVIGASMALFISLPNVLTFIIAFVVIGGRQLGLAILMHDASHRLLFKSKWLNDIIGGYLCGDFIGADISLYRPYHLSHHQNTQQENDPDLSLSQAFPISKKSFKRKLIRDFFGITGYYRRLFQFKTAFDKKECPQPGFKTLLVREKRFFISNLCLFVLLVLLKVWWAYFILWVLPLLTWYQLISRIRNIAEHAVVGDKDDPLRNTRTTYANLLIRILWSPYWVNYHLEHHLFVFTPCWKLATAHQYLKANGFLEKMEVEKSYGEVIRKATSKPDNSSTTKGKPIKSSMI